LNQPWEWNEEDLRSLIANRVQESIELDYKECDALGTGDGKKNEISKDVSAFANSGGGTIVYGMVEDGHVPVALDSGYNPDMISKEWLDQVINSRIQRRIDGVRINQVELSGSNLGRVAYVVSVPQSVRAPHQAADKRFYKRFNFQSVAMEEYEIRDVARRSEAPDLRLTFNVVEHERNGETLRIQLNPFITNESPSPAEYTVAILFLDARLVILHGGAGLRPAPETVLSVGGRLFPVHRRNRNLNVPATLPIFQGLDFAILDTPLIVSIPQPERYVLGWQLNSPRMTSRLGASFLVWDGTNPPSTQSS